MGQRLAQNTDLPSIFESIVESMVDAILVLDTQEHIVTFNKKFASLWNLGSNLSSTDVKQGLLQFISSQTKDPDFFLSEFKKGRSNPPHEYSYEVERKDERILECFIIPHMYEGVCIGSVISYRDITERKKADRELKLSEARFRTVFESAPIGITLLDTEGTLVKVNPAFCAMLGYTSAEVRSLGILGVSHPAEYEVNQVLLSELFRGRLKRFEMEKRYIPKKGPPFWAHLLVSLGLGPEGMPSFGIGIIRDINKERAAREALAISEERFRTVFEWTHLGIALIDRNGNLVKVNPALEKMLGYTEAELINKGIQGVTHPDDFSACWSLLSKLGTGETDHYEMEKRYVRKDGTVIWCTLVGSVGRDGKGQPIFSIGMLSEITERKRHQESRDKLLYQEWVAHQNTLRAVRLRDEFIALASHELRTPLTPLKLQLEYLHTYVLSGEIGFQSKTPNILRIVERAKEQVEHIEHLVEDMLEASTIRSGRLILSLAQVDLSEIIKKVIRNISKVAKTSGSRLEVQLAPQIRGYWDPLRIEQVISNLLTNAIKYGLATTVRIVTSLEGSNAKIMVSDSGMGISQENQKKIFEEFNRVLPIGTYGGFGLGLYITQQIILAHHGRISVESNIGQGTTFTVIIPLAQEDSLSA